MHIVPLVLRRTVAIGLLCVVVGGCGGSASRRVDPTVATEPAPEPTVVVTVAATSVPVTSSTMVQPSSTAAPATTVDPGPSDEEIQAILTDLDAKEGAIFAAFKQSLTITPEIDRMIEEAFGAGSDGIRRSLLTHLKDRGRSIAKGPSGPKTGLIRIRSESPECFVVFVWRDAAFLGKAPLGLNQLYRYQDGRWVLLGEISEGDAAGFDGTRCDLA